MAESFIATIHIGPGEWFGVLATSVNNFGIDNVKIDTNRDGEIADRAFSRALTLRNPVPPDRSTAQAT